MKRLLFVLAVLLPLVLTPAAGADVLLSALDLGDKRFTEEGVLVFTVRYLCPEGYVTNRDTGSVGVVQLFTHIDLRAGKQIGQRLTCDGTWNRVKVHIREGDKPSGGTRQFTSRLPLTIGAGFFAGNPTPQSRDSVSGQDEETVLVE